MLTVEKLESLLAKPSPGGVILFVGAGFSRDATNILDKPIPLAKEFSAELAKDIGEAENLPLTVVADIYNEKIHSKTAFLTKLKESFTAKSLSTEQINILRYPWKRIYTTNYDDVLEWEKGPNGVRPDAYTRDTLPLAFESPSRQIVHLNGFVGAINVNSVVDDFAMTLSSYFDKSHFASRWAGTMRTDFELASAIVFAGYSMADTDVSNIIGSNPTFKEKCLIFQRSDLAHGEERFLARFGSVVKTGVDGLSSKVEAALKDGMPRISISGPENFIESHLPSGPTNKIVSDAAVENLLIRGVYDRDIFLTSKFSGGRTYLFDRSDAQTITNALQDLGKSVLVHGDLGSGKTFFLEQIIVLLLRAQTRVFVFERSTEHFNFDIEYFKQLTDPYVLIVEDALSNSDLLELLQAQLSKPRILATVRTSAFEVKSYEVRSAMPDETLEWDFNKLRETDLGGLISLLNTGAYWPDEMKNRSEQSKKRFLRDSCKMELSSILLGIVKSAILHSEIKSAFSLTTDESRKATQVAALALCLNLIEVRPTFALLSELLGRDVYSISTDAKLERLRYFIPVSGIEVLARSTIMSEFILRSVVPDDFLIETLLSAIEISSALYKKANRYRLINSKFMQFSFISKLVASKNNSHERITEYYDRLGDLGYKDFSPHFWLQYAIACRVAKQYKQAERYFSEARNTAARQHHFDTYQIDNAEAMFLLDSRMESGDWTDYFSALQSSSNLSLTQTHLKKTGYYPYRVAARFFDYLEVRGEKLSQSQRNKQRKSLQHGLRDFQNFLFRFAQLPL